MCYLICIFYGFQFTVYTLAQLQVSSRALNIPLFLNLFNIMYSAPSVQGGTEKRMFFVVNFLNIKFSFTFAPSFNISKKITFLMKEVDFHLQIVTFRFLPSDLYLQIVTFRFLHSDFYLQIFTFRFLPSDFYLQIITF